MPLETSLPEVLTRPSRESLWQVRGDLISLVDRLDGPARDDARWSIEIVGQFHAFLVNVQSKMTAHEYSQIASKMDMGSVGLLALQDLVTDRERLFKKLLLGGLSEGLMVLATLQYVKAWQAEASQACDEASWWLFEGLWRLSSQMSPALAAEERRAQIEAVPAPARDPDVTPAVGRRFWRRSFRSFWSAASDGRRRPPCLDPPDAWNGEDPSQEPALQERPRFLVRQPRPGLCARLQVPLLCLP